LGYRKPLILQGREIGGFAALFEIKELDGALFRGFSSLSTRAEAGNFALIFLNNIRMSDYRKEHFSPQE
jgi:hypothetical protein